MSAAAAAVLASGLHHGPDISIPATAALAGSTLGEAARQLAALADAHMLRETAADRYQLHDLQQALSIARETNEARVEGSALSSLSETFGALGRPAASRDHLRQALAAWRRAGDRRNEAETHYRLGDLLSGIGEALAAHEHWHAAQAIFEEFGDPRGRELRYRLEIRPAATSRSVSMSSCATGTFTGMITPRY